MRALALGVILFIGAGQDAPKRTVVEIRYGEGKKVKYTIVLPKDKTKKNVPMLFGLPPGPGSPEMVTAVLNTWERETFAHDTMLVVPQILGPDLATEAKDLIPAVFDSINKNFSFDKSRVALVGPSNGGLGAFHAAIACPDRFRSILAMPGGWEGDAAALKALKGKKIRIMVGEKDDGWRQLAEATRDGLKAAGGECEVEVLPGQEHIIRFNPKQLFEWIAKTIEK